MKSSNFKVLVYHWRRWQQQRHPCLAAVTVRLFVDPRNFWLFACYVLCTAHPHSFVTCFRAVVVIVVFFILRVCRMTTVVLLGSDAAAITDMS